MEFAKYYNVTKILKELIDDRKVISYTKDCCKELYICSDTHDFWIGRLYEDLNSDFEEEKGKYLFEREIINKSDFIDFLSEKEKKVYIANNKSQIANIIDRLSVNRIAKYLILMDDENGTEAYDNYECNSYKEAIEVIDGGFGIIELE